MKVMVFDVGGTGIKYSVMDEQLNRTDTGSTPTPADSQEHFLNTLREIYLPHKGEVDGIALSLPGFIDAEQGVVKGGGAPSLAYNVGTPVSAPGWPRPAATAPARACPPMHPWMDASSLRRSTLGRPRPTRSCAASAGPLPCRSTT